MARKTTYPLQQVRLEEMDAGSAESARRHALRIALTRCLVAVTAAIACAVAWRNCLPNGAAALYAATAFLTSLLLNLLDVADIEQETQRSGNGRAASGTWRQWVPLFLLLASVVAIAAVPPFSTGARSTLNQAIYLIDEAFDAYVPLLATTETPAFNLACIPFGMLTGLLTWVIIRHSLTVAWTLYLGLTLAGSIWLYPPDALPSLACCTVSWLCGWNLCTRRSIPSAKNLAATLCGTAIAAAMACGAAALYAPSAAVSQVWQAMVGAVDEARYGTDTLPEGDVAQSSDMNEGDESRLSVTFEALPQESTYLRGFVGANYQDAAAQWTALDHTAYEGEWQGLFTWLSGEGFQASTQYAECMEINEQVTGEGALTWSATVEATGANRRYVYAPSSESSLSGTSTEQGRDGSTLSSQLFGSSSYSVEAVGGAVSLDAAPAWLEQESTSDAGESYLESESVYRAFVQDNYLDITDEDRALIEDLIFNEETWDAEEDVSVYSVVSRVRIMLSTLASYTTAPQAYTGQDDGFLSWFLTQAREGNAAYFSTAAVEAFRAQGIPARYVEGYLISSDTLQDMLDSGQTQVDLTAQDAHAWVEIYLDGQGWVPIDVTPGFYTQPFSAQNVIPVNQETSSGDSDQVDSDGAVAGDVPPAEEEETAEEGIDIAQWILGAMVVAVLAALVLLAALEAKRRTDLAALTARLESHDQATLARASYDRLAMTLLAAGVPFDAKRPFDATEDAVRAFQTVRPEEYRRAIYLYQKAVFGKAALKAHELRTIRRFNARLEAELPAADGLRRRIVNRYRYLQ